MDICEDCEELKSRVDELTSCVDKLALVMTGLANVLRLAAPAMQQLEEYRKSISEDM